jgi:hypothetical protein
MIYRISLASNPRIIFIFLIILALPAIGVAAVIFLGVFWGIVISAAALFLDYHFFRYTVNVLKSRVSINREGVKCVTPAKEELFFPWETITRAGSCRVKGERPFLFLYSEAENKFLKIPDEYSQFAKLEEELRSKTDFQEVDLKEGMTLEDYLKAQSGQ